jgi:hypothetical protein
MWGCWSVHQFAQIVHHQMRTMMPRLLGVPLARDADDKPKPPGRAGLYSRDGILDDNRPRRLNPEQLCSPQKRIRGRFPGQLLSMDHVAVDSRVETVSQFGGL